MIGVILVYALGLHHYLTLEALKSSHQQWQDFSNQQFLLSIVGYCVIYIFAVTLSIPGAIFLTLAGGLLFGPWLGAACVIFSATIGSTLIFVAIHTAIGGWLKNKAQHSSKFGQISKGFTQNAFWYCLFLRLVPLFPFWLVNIVPAILGIKLRTYVLATGIGIIPASVVYTHLGASLVYILDKNEPIGLGIIFELPVLLPLLGLGVLSLLPAVWARKRAQ